MDGVVGGEYEGSVFRVGLVVLAFWRREVI